MSSAVLNAWLLLPAKWAINFPRLPHEKTACRADNTPGNSTMFLVRATDDRDAGRPSKTTILFASFLGDRPSSLAPLQGASPIGRYPGLKPWAILFCHFMA